MKNLVTMKKIALFSLSILCIWTLNGSYTIASHTSMNIDINKEFKNARELYSRRENHENLKSAIDIYQNVLKQIYNSLCSIGMNGAEVLIELSRCYFKMAEYHATDNNEKAAWFEMGEAYGREAISLDRHAMTVLC